MKLARCVGATRHWERGPSFDSLGHVAPFSAPLLNADTITTASRSYSSYRAGDYISGCGPSHETGALHRCEHRHGQRREWLDVPRTFNFRYDDLAEVLRAKLQGVRRAQQAQGLGGGSNATSGRVSEGAPHQQYNVSAASSRQQARGMRRRSDWMRRRRSEAAYALTL